jgi:two-component system, chemotaxis family, response regulator Rcp1
VTNRIHVLLVEDNPADADLSREVLEDCAVPVELVVAVSGTEACDYIHKLGRFDCARTPNLILLDLNLPGIDGKGVLAQIKQDAKLKQVPVCILTSSSSEKDIAECYSLGANCYVVKAIDFKSFQALMRTLEAFWFGTVRLPTVRHQSTNLPESALADSSGRPLA